MPRTWICGTTGEIVKVDQNQGGINPAVRKEFEASRIPKEQEKANALLKPGPSQNPDLN